MRIAFKFVVFLILGAIVNVAVAWGVSLLCALPTTWETTEESNTWPFETPERWPEKAESRSLRGIGYSWDNFLAIRKEVPNLREWFMIDLFRFGWPWHALASERWEEFTITTTLPITTTVRLEGHPPPSVWREGIVTEVSNFGVLPLNPIWPGFALNSFVYAMSLWLLVLVLMRFRRLWRIWRGLCPRCKYPVGASDVCTECGAELSQRMLKSRGSMGLPPPATPAPGSEGESTP